MAISAQHLGRLEQVDELRDVWSSEAADFTPWLALEQNIALLADTIGLDLEVEGQEKDVGPFRADILCKDTANGNWVLIENQLERTDHTHLGQLLTYASGLDAVTIVWIAKRFTDEHRAALDWLNKATHEGINFFGLEIELWRIGESAIAPKFNVVSQPNDWARRIREEASELTDSKRLQLDFWQSFCQLAKDSGSKLKMAPPVPNHWLNVAIGRSGVRLGAVASLWNPETKSYDTNEIRAEFNLYDTLAKARFDQLVLEQPEIEAAFGESLVWQRPEKAQMCRIFVRRTVNLHDRNQWPEYQAWLLEKLHKLAAVFGPRVKSLASADEVIPDVPSPIPASPRTSAYA